MTMNKTFKLPQRPLKGVLAFLLVGMILSIASCSNDDENLDPPVITKITKTDPESLAKDSTFTEAFPNQMVVIHGENFYEVQKVYFNGVEAYFNRNYTSEKSIIVTIPEDAPTAATDPDVPNSVRVVTAHGEATFSFQLLVSAPVVTRVSNEFAQPGSTITLYGRNFYAIDNVSFITGNADLEGSEVSIVGDSIINVTVPQDLSEVDSLAVLNDFGRASYPFRNETGIFSDFDELNPYSWGATAVQNDPAAYPGNEGNYVTMEFSDVGANNWNWWEGGRSVNLNPVQLLPESEVSNPIGDYAIKFEIYVKEPWSTGTLMVLPQNTWDYVHLYRPWRVNSTTTKAFSTEGWRTVTLPLNMFLTNDGTGDPAPDLATLLGSSGNAPFSFYFINMSGATIDNFAAAIDNIRIVRTSN